MTRALGIGSGDSSEGEYGERGGWGAVAAPCGVTRREELACVLRMEWVGCFGRTFPVGVLFGAGMGFRSAAVVGHGAASAGMGLGGLDVGDAGLRRVRGFAGFGWVGSVERGPGADGFGRLAGVGFGRGPGALALEQGEKNVGEAGTACVFGFGFAGEGGLFELKEDAEEREFSV